MDDVTLHAFRPAGRLSLDAIVTDLAAQLADACGLLYSREHCVVVRAASGRLLAVDGRDWSADPSVFEARVFNERGELRWWRAADAEQGEAVYLSESPLDVTGWREDAAATLHGLRPHKNSYVLWGQARSGPVPGWTPLVEAQIGEIVVPLDGVDEGGRVQLRTYEYIGEARLPDELRQHGNAAVVEERLLGLALYEGQEKTDE